MNQTEFLVGTVHGAIRLALKGASFRCLRVPEFERIGIAILRAGYFAISYCGEPRSWYGAERD